MGSSANIEVQVAKLVGEVKRVAAGLRQGFGAGRQVVEAAAATVSVGVVTEELIAAAVDSPGLEPLEHLLCALALKRAVIGMAEEKPWRHILAWRASAAIFDAEDLGLFPLRLDLLDEALEDPRVVLPRATLLFQRATTRQAIGERYPRDAELVHRDLREAYELALAERDLEVVVRVLSVMAVRVNEFETGREGV